jgi:hypothetical protein
MTAVGRERIQEAMAASLVRVQTREAELVISHPVLEIASWTSVKGTLKDDWQQVQVPASE